MTQTRRDDAGPVADRGAGARFAHARARLGGAQKSTVGVPAYLRYVNRRLGGQLAAAGFALRLTPDHLTAVSATLSAAGIALLALVDPSPAVGLGVAGLLLAGYAFDSADGQLSRVRGDGTPAGAWLDHVVDVAKTAALHAAVVVSLYRFGDLGSDGWLLVPLGFGVVNVTFFFAMMLRDELGARPPKGGDGSPVRSLLLVPMDYGALCAAFVLLAWTPLFLGAYGGLFVVMTAFAARSFVGAHRALAGTDTTPTTAP